MNNFLRQFGNFKKNSMGLNEYVDFLGSHYIQDPKTGQWVNNGRSLNEQMFMQEAMNAFGGYGEEGSGGKNKTSVAPVYTLGFAATAGGVALANPFDNFIVENGDETPSDIRYFTQTHNQPVQIKLKLTSKNMEDFTPNTAVLLFFAFTTLNLRITFDLKAASVNDESDIYTVPAAPFTPPPNPTSQFIYASDHGAFTAEGNQLSFGIAVINAVTNETIDSFTITDTVPLP
jgi:hypothetical protein